METFVQVLHYIICLFLIAIILLQAGRGAEIGASFGGSTQTLFGPRGAATFLNKLTAVVALAFVATSIGLAEFAKHKTVGSALDVAPPLSAPTAPLSPPVPAEPEPPAPAPETSKDKSSKAVPTLPSKPAPHP